MADSMVSAAAGRLIGLIEEQARYHVNLVIGAEDELNTIRYVLDDAENQRFKNSNVNYWLSKLEQASYDMEDVLDEWNHAILKLATSPKQKVLSKDDILYPKMLTDEDCWLLMRRIACLGRDEVGFEDIGKEIAKKCNGLPLAARTLGSLLRSKSTLGDWEVVLNSDIWEMREAKLELFPHLLLSYNELSPAIRHCFSYCAVFPKDSKINVEELIGNWMALGYLGSDSIGSGMEDRGREYFNILAMHSLFQSFEKDNSDEKILFCKIHDIVHDFAQFLRNSGKVDGSRTRKCTTCGLGESRSLFWNDKESPPNLCDCHTSLRVLSLSRCNLQQIPQIIESFIHLRWLNLDGNELSLEGLKIIFQLYNLETLNLCYCSIEEIPIEIGNLIRLRHLDLSCNMSLEELPREIGKLVHLRHLNLSRNESMKKLPSEIEKLINLRHLNLSRNKSLPREIENLVNLEHVDLSWNVSLEELPREIGSLVHLKLLNFTGNTSMKELPREIGNLIQLRHLNLRWNESLTELPREIGNLIHMTHLNLNGCKYLKELPEEIGNLSHLRYLNLSQNVSLEKLPESMCCLQKLQTLDVKFCKRLCELPDGLAHVFNLSSLAEFPGGSPWSKLGLMKNLSNVGRRVTLVITLGGDGDLERAVEDAREAKLRNKIHIEELEIIFEDEMNEMEESSCSSSNRVRMDVIDALEPHPNVRKLSIENYKGSKLPSWMVSPLNQLWKLNLYGCPHLTSFPSRDFDWSNGGIGNCGTRILGKSFS